MVSGNACFILVCGMVITLTYRLKHHIKQIHEKESHTYFCAQCSFSTYARSLLDKHVSSLHTLPVEERKTHMCDQCGAKFVDKVWSITQSCQLPLGSSRILKFRGSNSGHSI